MTTTLSIHDTTCTIYDIWSTVYDITFTICVTSDIGCISDITHSMVMTYPLYMETHSVIRTQPLCKLTAMMSDITPTVSVSSLRWHTHLYWCIAVSVTSQQVCKSSHLAHVWHHTQSTSHHIHSLWHQWSCFMTSRTLHSRHQISAIWQHIHSLGHHTALCMISSPLYLTSRPLYLCHHTHPIDDITTIV